MLPTAQEQLVHAGEALAARDTRLAQQEAKLAEHEHSLALLAKAVARLELRIGRLQRLREARKVRALELAGSLAGRDQRLAQVLDSLEALRDELADRDRSIGELRTNLQRGEERLRGALGERRALLDSSTATETRLRQDIAERDDRVAGLEQALAESLWVRAARRLRRLGPNR